jgi:hypothetical protein
LSTAAETESVTLLSATEALRLTAKAAPALLEVATLIDRDTVVATIWTESDALTESELPETVLFATDADTVFPIVFVTTLAAPAIEREIADTATLIEAETAVAVIDADSEALNVTAPPAVTGLPSIAALTESWMSFAAAAPASATATPRPWFPIDTDRLAATAVDVIVALSEATTETAPAAFTVALAGRRAEIVFAIVFFVTAAPSATPTVTLPFEFVIATATPTATAEIDAVCVA